MADENIVKLLEIYKKCMQNGECASLFFETKNGKDSTITFSINCPVAGAPASGIRKRKTPSQLKRDIARREAFLAKKLDGPTNGNASDKLDEEKEEKVLLVEPNDEINLEAGQVCEKVFVFPKLVIDNHNIGIEYDVTEKLEAKGVKVRKVQVDRSGDPIRGEYIRSEVLIEPMDMKKIENKTFEIENCWVLPNG